MGIVDIECRLPPEFHFEAIMGFLPPVVPRLELPSLLGVLSDAARELPEHYHAPGASVRPWLDDRFGAAAFDLDALAALDTVIEGLDVAELDGLATTLGVLCHAYRWDSAPPRPDAYALDRIALPAAMERAWTSACRRLGVPRVGNLYAMVLCNWRFMAAERRLGYAPDELGEHSVDVGHAWLRGPEREELRTFVLTALLTEAAGVHVVRTALGLLIAAREQDLQRMRFLFDRLEDEVDAMARPFRLLIQKKRLRPDTFLTLVQPTTIWGLDEGQGPLEGASGPQVGALQILDALLGVPRKGPMARAVLCSRAYLPPSQRSFLESFEAEAPLVRRVLADSGDDLLRARFTSCATMLRGWRQMHQKRGALYLRGEASTLPYTSTGGVIALADERVRVFEAAMSTRIDETEEALGSLAPVPAALPGQRALRFFTIAELEALLAVGVRREFVCNEVLARAGTRRAGLFIVVAGAARLERDDGYGVTVVSRLGPGAVFGEEALLTSGSLGETLVADGPGALVGVTSDALFARCDRDARFALHLYQSLGALVVERLAERDRRLARAIRPSAANVRENGAGPSGQAQALAALGVAAASAPSGARILTVLRHPAHAGDALPPGRGHIVHVPDPAAAAGVLARVSGAVDVQVEWGEPDALLERFAATGLRVDRLAVALGEVDDQDLEALERWSRRALAVASPGAGLTVALAGDPARAVAALTDGGWHVTTSAITDALTIVGAVAPP